MNEQQRFPWGRLLAVVILASMTTGCVGVPQMSIGKVWEFPWLPRRGETPAADANDVPCQCETCEGKLAEPSALVHAPLVNRVLPLGQNQVDPASYTDYPPVQNPDTAYAVAGPVHAGSELVPRQKMASEIALELKSENERLREECQLTTERLQEFERRLGVLENEVMTARQDARDAQQKLQSMEQELREWQQQTVQMYSAVKRSEQQVLDTLAGLTAVVEQMVAMQDSEASAPVEAAAKLPVQRQVAEETDAVKASPRLLPTSPVYVSPVRPTSYRFHDG